MHVRLKNEKTGELVQSKVGFSWTLLFFGFFVPLFRRDFLWALIMALLQSLSIGLVNFVLCFLYNDIFITSKLKEGFVPLTEEDASILRKKGLFS